MSTYASSAALKDEMAAIEKQMSHQSCYKSYRALLRAVPSGQPCIPYLGMFLQDLTFIGDGNPDIVDGTLVNFYKHQKSAKVLADIQRLQETSHTRPGGLTKNGTVTHWLRYGKPCLEEKETYNVSLKIEPRNPSETLERLLMDEQALRKQLTELQVRNATLEEANQKLQATVAYLSEQLGASQAHVRKTMALGPNSLAALRAQIAEEEQEQEEGDGEGDASSVTSNGTTSPRAQLLTPAAAAAAASRPAAVISLTTQVKRSSQRRSGRRSIVRKSVRGFHVNPAAGNQLYASSAALMPLPSPPPSAPPPVPPVTTLRSPSPLSDSAARNAGALTEELKRNDPEDENRRLKRRALAAKPSASAAPGGRDRGPSIAPLEAPEVCLRHCS